jgi:ferredoxin
MEFSTGKLIYFSPTQTTKKIVMSIAQRFSFARIEEYDLTPPGTDARVFSEIGAELTILGTPVYAGRVPKEAVKRLRPIKAHGTPAIIVVVYGNREFEDALLELNDIAVEQGFTPVAAGAFIGEHSYATLENPIAYGRPDEADLQKAGNWGELIIQKLRRFSSLEDLPFIKVPGNFPYKERMPGSNESPITQERLCTLCGTCASVCPIGAIVVTDTVIIEPGQCLLCQACVKNCPTGARITDVPRIKQVAQWLYTNCSQRKEPALFL